MGRFIFVISDFRPKVPDEYSSFLSAVFPNNFVIMDREDGRRVL